MLDFIQVTVGTVFKTNISAAFKHAVSLVIIDGLCLGIDVAGEKQKGDIIALCN
jgi:hypothetical protein